MTAGDVGSAGWRSRLPVGHPLKTRKSQKKEENGEKYVTATTEAEFHEALNRGFAVEVTRKLADEIGVPMNEDVGTVAEIDQARNDRHD